VSCQFCRLQRPTLPCWNFKQPFDTGHDTLKHSDTSNQSRSGANQRSPRNQEAESPLRTLRRQVTSLASLRPYAQSHGMVPTNLRHRRLVLVVLLLQSIRLSTRHRLVSLVNRLRYGLSSSPPFRLPKGLHQPTPERLCLLQASS
jgi:hypothetical protein